MTRAELVEIGAKAAREVWRDREAVRADTLDWEQIDRHERSACLAAQAAALAAIEAAGFAVVPREALMLCAKALDTTSASNGALREARRALAFMLHVEARDE
jgi:hypothetical protein